MKIQIIYNILDELEQTKLNAKFEGLSISAEKHKRSGLEQAYQIVLKNADIPDIRPGGGKMKEINAIQCFDRAHDDIGYCMNAPTATPVYPDQTRCKSLQKAIRR
jgi:hypothetical protein